MLNHPVLVVIRKDENKFAHTTLLLYNNYKNDYITKENTYMNKENKNTKQKSVKSHVFTKTPDVKNVKPIDDLVEKWKNIKERNGGENN